MNGPSRRDFLVSAGAGAAVAGAAAITSVPAADAAPAHVAGPLIAYVTDVHRGDITVMVGESAVVVRDADLASRIARAAG